MLEPPRTPHPRTYSGRCFRYVLYEEMSLSHLRQVCKEKDLQFKGAEKLLSASCYARLCCFFSPEMGEIMTTNWESETKQSHQSTTTHSLGDAHLRGLTGEHRRADLLKLLVAESWRPYDIPVMKLPNLLIAQGSPPRRAAADQMSSMVAAEQDD